jgi:hypothetical protein
MKKDEKTNSSPEELAEMRKAIAQFDGPIKKIPAGKRTIRPPSKKPGESGSRQGHWTERQERLAFGD